MQLLVGIPTHRRPDLLRTCLASIAGQAGDLPQVSVFVADNDPVRREGTAVVAELAEGFRFPLSSTVVEEPGISAVRNAILAEAQRSGAEFIAMIDDDEIASPGWLAQLLIVQSACNADVVGGPVSRETPVAAPTWMRTGIFRVQDYPSGPIDRIDATGNVLLSCRALDRVGWPEFDHAFGLSGGGDTEYFLRMKKMGLSFAWANNAIVDEPIPATRYSTIWFLKRQFRYGNIGDSLHRIYNGHIVPSRAWALRNLIATPLLIVLAIHPSLRLKALKRVAYSAGIISSALGYRFLEYAERHERRA